MAKEKEKRNGESLMKFEKQRRYVARQKQEQNKQRKKMKDRLLYLTKKEAKKQLTEAEIREKISLQNSL